MNKILVCGPLIMMLAISHPCLAGAGTKPDSIADFETRLDEMIKRNERTVADMQKRLEALENGKRNQASDEAPASPAVTETVSDLEGDVEALRSDVDQMLEDATRITVNLYATLEYENFENTTSIFDARNIELFVGAQLTDRLRAFSEIEFERTAQTSAGPRQGQVEVEQGWLEFYINQAIVPRFGVILVPFGRFNLEHFDPVRDLTDRPIVMRRIIPVTWAEAGAGFTGNMFLGDSLANVGLREFVLEYQFFLINGLTNAISDTSTRSARGAFGSDNNNNKAFAGRINIIPTSNVELGASGYVGTYDPTGRTIGGFDMDWKLTQGPFELIGEYAVFNLEKGGLQSGSTTMTVPTDLHGGYIQGNYHFWFDVLNESFLGEGFSDPTFTGVIRFGHASISDDTDSNTGTNKEKRVTIGLNYRPIESMVFKAEYQFNDTTNEPLERGNNDGFITSVTGAF